MWASNELMNFCNPVFDTSVTCDTVCCEGYDVTNLVSKDANKRRCGFLCDRFIKPPVEVTLEFPFDISLSHIQIVTQVGQQKSSGVEVSSTYSQNSFKGSSASAVERIGFVNIESHEKGVVFFCPQLHGRQWSHPEAKTMKMRSFTWIQRSALVHVTKLTIRIVRTFGSSVPGIGSIEVWGAPSSRLPRIKMDEVKTLWRSAAKPSSLKSPEVSVKKHDVKTKAKDDIVKSFISDEVPEDFIDAITCEIMSLPMVLPSGKIVDQQTLERHAAAEAFWGRPPSDPFTGIFFKSGCQPVLDVALKGRLDRFLVMNQNRDDLKMVPRTVGRVGLYLRSNHPHASLSTSGISSLLRSCKRVGSQLQVGSERNKVRRTSFTSNFTETITKNEGRSCGNIPEKKINHDIIVSCQQTPNVIVGTEECLSSQINVKSICDMSNSVVKKASHEEKLDRSLQDAIEAALSGLPSFVNPALPKLDIKNCSSCKQSKNLFSLPCDHYLCRNCLVYVTKQAPSACPCCDTTFKSSDPIRCHD